MKQFVWRTYLMQRTSERLWFHFVLNSSCSQNLTAVLIRPYYVFVVREKIKMTNDWRKKEISQGSKHIQDSWTPKPSDELMMLMTVNFLFIIYKPVAVFTSLFLSPCWIAILHITYLTSFFVFFLWVNQKKFVKLKWENWHRSCLKSPTFWVQQLTQSPI